MDKIILTKDFGAAKKGDIFIRGLHDTPDYYKNSHQRSDFFWHEGTSREQNSFFLESWISDDYFDTLPITQTT